MKKPSYLNTNILFKYLLLFVMSVLLNNLLKRIIDFDQLLYTSFSEQFTSRQIEKIFEFQKKWEWISYLFILILILIKTSIITTLIYIGLFFSNKELGYNYIWNIVLKAEFIFLLVPVCKIIWFFYFQTDYDLNDIQNFYPFSALNITGYKNLETWLIYPFQVLNVFELFYIIYLGNQLGKATNTDTDYGLKIVSISYLPGLFLWITIVMFFTLNYT